MRSIVRVAVSLVMLLSGCSTAGGPTQTVTPVTPTPSATAPTTVVPSSTGTPNSIAVLGSFEFVSVQGTGQIFTYNISSGAQVAVGTPYTTPCGYPSGMVVTNIAGADIMAAVCLDTGSLVTLTVHADGSLSALGSVGGLALPYPGIVLDGTNVLIPLLGVGPSTNGGVAKVSITSPAHPAITGMATLVSAVTGGYASPAYLDVAGGKIFVEAGSETLPLEMSSTIQVVDETTMTLVGNPLNVPHSPQQIVVQGSVAYVTSFDAMALQSIDISNPAKLASLQVFVPATPNPVCHALSLAVHNTTAYVGCYKENTIEEFDISDPKNIKLMQTISGIVAPQRLVVAGNALLVTSSVAGGQVYLIALS